MTQLHRRALLMAFAAVAVEAPRAWGQAGPASLLDFGARGDGRSNDTPALKRALASGRMLDGGGRTYVVGGELTAGVNFQGLKNCTLRQLQRADHLRTLVISGARGFQLQDVTVIRGPQNDDALVQADMQHNAGIWVQDGSAFRLDRVSVSGGGIGTGLVVFRSRGFSVTDARVRAIHYRLSRRPPDDMLQGIWIVNSSGFELVRPVVSDLGGLDDQGFSRDNNRAIAISKCADFHIRDLDVSDCGQGLDVTGSDGNHDFEVIGGHAHDCFTWGFKFANSAQRGRVSGALAERCGLGGFVVSGRSELTDPTPQDIVIADCRALDCGIPGNDRTSFGFGVLRARPDPDYPRRVRFVRCVAIDRRRPRGMKWGFFNEIRTPRDQRNTVENCTSKGALVADFQGF